MENRYRDGLRDALQIVRDMPVSPLSTVTSFRESILDRLRRSLAKHTTSCVDPLAPVSGSISTGGRLTCTEQLFNAILDGLKVMNGLNAEVGSITLTDKWYNKIKNNGLPYTHVLSIKVVPGEQNSLNPVDHDGPVYHLNIF